ncbi:RNA polymerase sigma factor [Arenimonas alkanexedens]
MSQLPVAPDRIAAAQAGDPVALNEVLACSRQDLTRYAEYHCAVNDVEDAVQETLIMASSRLSDLRSIESFTSWMFRIVKRECNRMRRAWRLLTNQDEDERIAPVVTPPPLEWRMEITRMMTVLPPHYRTILLLRDVEGLSLDELAKALDLTLPATKSRLHRARSVARDLLSDPGTPVDLGDFQAGVCRAASPGPSAMARKA